MDTDSILFQDFIEPEIMPVAELMRISDGDDFFMSL